MRALLTVKRLGAIEAMKKLPQRQAGHRIAQVRRNFHRWRQDERPFAKGRVRDCQRGICGNPDTTRPQDEVEIERSRLPPLPAPFAAEMVLDHVQAAKQLYRLQHGRDKSRCVRILAV